MWSNTQNILWWVAAGIAAIILLAAALWLLWWWFPKWQVKRRFEISDPKARADVEDNFRKTVSQLIASAVTVPAVLIGTWLAYSGTQQTIEASREGTRQTVEASRKQAADAYQASRDQLISPQVSKGFELLERTNTSTDKSGDKTVIRLGGIYALEGVMNTSEQYYKPVLEALCAFVRDGTKDVKGEGPPATDIQAALTVIGRRGPGEGRVDLTGAHIPKAHLFSADLRGADLRGADLSGADLFRAKLTDANLFRADLSDAVLIGAYLTRANLYFANLSRAKLSGANLTNAVNVTQDQLDTACGGDDTKLPSDMTIKQCP
jgi:Pentapeptide repeats (8 copies)